MTVADPNIFTWHTFADRPEPTRKIVVLDDEGTAELFFVSKEGFVDTDGEFYPPGTLNLTYFTRWAYVPDDQPMQCEIREENPISLYGGTRQ